MTDPLTLVDAIGRVGLPTVSAALILWMVIRAQARQEKLTDRLFQQVLHGDGNGGPSIAKVLQRLDSTDAEVAGIKADVVQLRREHDATMRRCQPLRRAAGDGGMPI